MSEAKHYCPEKLKPGGCTLHNLHCGYPACDRAPASPLPEAAEPVAFRSMLGKMRTAIKAMGDDVSMLQRSIDARAPYATPPAQPVLAPVVREPLTDDDVQWVVNDNAELGVKIGEQFFFLYKGHSLVYERGLHDDDTPMHWRPVFKREFGECCHPINYKDPNYIGTVSLDDSDEWKPLPAANGIQATTGEQSHGN